MSKFKKVGVCLSTGVTTFTQKLWYTEQFKIFEQKYVINGYGLT